MFRIEVADGFLRTLEQGERARLLKRKSHRRPRKETAGDHPCYVGCPGMRCQRSPFSFTFAGRLDRPKCCGTLGAARFCAHVQPPAEHVGPLGVRPTIFRPPASPREPSASACRSELSARTGCPCSYFSNPAVACVIAPLAGESSSSSTSPCCALPQLSAWPSLA